MLDAKELGDLIKKKRIEQHLTQKELASKLGIVNTAVFKYEKGMIGNIPIEARLLLIDILNISPNDILPNEIIEKYFEGYGFKVHDKWKFYKRKTDNLTPQESNIFAEKNEEAYQIFLNLSDDFLPSIVKKYTYLHEDILAINMSILSQDDQERILGILAKYNKPRIK